MSRNPNFHTSLHPELRQGEVFLTNANPQTYSIIKWNSKRKGRQPYDGEGNPINASAWFPVFIQERELEKSGTTLSETRCLHRQERGDVLENTGANAKIDPTG